MFSLGADFAANSAYADAAGCTREALTPPERGLLDREPRCLAHRRPYRGLSGNFLVLNLSADLIRVMTRRIEIKYAEHAEAA